MVPLPQLKSTVIVLEHRSGAYTKCVVTQWNNGWARTHMTLQYHASPHSYGPWGRKNMINLRWLKFCGSIKIAQVQCIGAVTSI